MRTITHPTPYHRWEILIRVLPVYSFVCFFVVSGFKFGLKFFFSRGVFLLGIITSILYKL